MKKLLIMLMLVIGFNANAGLITLDVSNSEIAVGDSINISISAQNFDFTDTFSFNLAYDSSIFAYDEFSLISDLFFSNPIGIFEVNAFDGYIAFSFLDLDLKPIPNGDFVLASFNLTALVEGTSSFLFTDVEFYQNGFTPVNVNSSSNALVKVVDVPEPATWVLFLLALALFSRKSLAENV